LDLLEGDDLVIKRNEDNFIDFLQRGTRSDHSVAGCEDRMMHQDFKIWKGLDGNNVVEPDKLSDKNLCELG
jgi:hypothetical protein